ncbi:basic proline-rich protein-like [Cervus canadensis]|uniref:basic proline-rich protein-like n=1 Tax=Cervus canadensis TaxID=1574408 RepID=UPI001C9E8C4B|nr:basic proline-rich protein-like [Cervus canadensis]
MSAGLRSEAAAALGLGFGGPEERAADYLQQRGAGELLPARPPPLPAPTAALTRAPPAQRTRSEEPGPSSPPAAGGAREASAAGLRGRLPASSRPGRPPPAQCGAGRLPPPPPPPAGLLLRSAGGDRLALGTQQPQTPPAPGSRQQEQRQETERGAASDAGLRGVREPAPARRSRAMADGGEGEDEIQFLRTDDEVVLQCTATIHKEQQKLCLAAEGFGNRLCFLESTSNSKVR